MKYKFAHFPRIGIIGGGQLALMLTEAAKKRNLEVCVQTKSCDDPAGSKADHVIEADPLKIRGNKSLINECEQGRDINSLLKGPICHSGFKRLNWV